MLLKPRQGGYKKDILLIFTELFMKLNILANNIEIVSIRLENEHSFSNRDEYVALKSPENMLGIQALWDIVLKGKDDNIAKEVANFITAGLYTRPELDKVDRNDGYIDYMKELIDKVIYLIREEEKKEGFETDKDAQRKYT